MNKKFILFSATVFGIAGAYVPFLFGDEDIFSGWSILAGFIGGILGVWIGAVLSRRFG